MATVRKDYTRFQYLTQSMSYILKCAHLAPAYYLFDEPPLPEISCLLGTWHVLDGRLARELCAKKHISVSKSEEIARRSWTDVKIKRKPLICIYFAHATQMKRNIHVLRAFEVQRVHFDRQSVKV